MGIRERAERLTDEVQRATSGPAAFMLPAPVKGMVQSMARLIEDMAREIEKLQGGSGEA